MARIVPRTPSFVFGMLCLVWAAPAARAQPPAFEVAAGLQYGVQDPERPLSPGWVVSTGFPITDRQTLVVEGMVHQDMSTQDRHFGPGDEVTDVTSRTRYYTLMAGVQYGPRGGRVVPFFQILPGGGAGRFTTDYVWPESVDIDAENANCGGFVTDAQGRERLIMPCLNVPYPRSEAERAGAFAMQPGGGMDVDLSRRVKLRLMADLPIFASGDYVVHRPRLSARVVVGFGR